MLKKITTFLILLIWPLSLFLANTPVNFLNYLLPAVLVGLSYVNPLPLLLIPLLQAKLTILPILYLLINFKKENIKYLAISILLFILLIKPFFGQTVFVKDYEREQQVLQKSLIYPSIFSARVFQNKARIPMDKIINNFFALTDPNNYFFGFAPRQITVDNQNLKKFPLLSLPFIFIGLYQFKKMNNKKFLLSILISSIINLSILSNFDRNDFILWIPLSLIVINGVNIFNLKFKYARYFYAIFIIFSSIEILRIFIK